MTREDIEKCFSYHATNAAMEYYEQEYLQPRISESRHVVDAFEAGAEWEHERLVEKACWWLRETAHFYVSDFTGELDDNGLLEDFKKAMEE